MSRITKHAVLFPKHKPWEQTRRMGMWRFVLRYGVLLWGVSVAVGYTAFNILIDWLHGRLIAGWPGWGSMAAVNLIVFPLAGGIIYGPLTWYLNERTYQKTLPNHHCPNCGYDLQGTFAAGKTQCPECGCETDTRTDA